MSRNSKYYGIRFDRRSQNFGFHMIAQSQLIAEARRSVFPYDRRRSRNFFRFAIRDLLRSYGNQPLELTFFRYSSEEGLALCSFASPKVFTSEKSPTAYKASKRDESRVNNDVVLSGTDVTFRNPIKTTLELNKLAENEKNQSINQSINKHGTKLLS